MSDRVKPNCIKPTCKKHWLGWRVFGLLARHRKTLIGLTFLILIASGLDLAVPFLTQRLIDRIIHSLQTGLAGSFQTLAFAGLGIFASTAVTRILRSFYNYRLVHAVTKCEDEVKTAAFENFLRLDTAFHGKVNTGEVVGALDRGGTAIYVTLFEILGQNLVPPLLVVIGVITALLLKNPLIAAIVFLPLPVYVLTVSRLGGRMQEIEQSVSRAFEAVTKESYDIASNVRSVKKFARETQEAQMQRRLLAFARDKHYLGERMWALVENAQAFIATAGRVSVITLAGWMVMTKRCSVGDFVLFVALQDMVYAPISALSIILPKLRRNLSRAERLFEILEQTPELKEVSRAARLGKVQSAVEFRNLSFKYADSSHWTLHAVNFQVPAGSTVALIGPSGSGKSTLMNLLQRLYDPQEGSVLLDGVDLRDIEIRSLREQIAVVPQEVDLFSRSIAENIGYGRDRVCRDEIEQAARTAQAHDFIQRCQDAYDAQVGERGLKLSGGERQRIGIARAILRNPEILIFDEATSHLDNESERLIQLSMDRITRGRTCFIIAHRLTTVAKADLVVVFAEGGIEAVGTHEELWAKSPTYRKLNSAYFSEMKRTA